MPRRDYRERQRKKTRYSSDSSDDYREKRSRSRREKSRSKKVSSSDKYKGSSSKQESSSSNSSTSSSRSRSSSTSSEDSRSKSRATHQKKSTSVQKEPDQQVKKFELDELYKEKDKVKVLEEIESDSFKQAVFKQSSSSKIIVDLEMDKIMLPVTSVATQEDQTLIHPNFLGDNEKRVDKWIKKLYIYRNQ